MLHKTPRDSHAPTTPQYAEVALPLPLRQTFTYSLPLALQDNIKIGARLLVPF